MLLTREDKLLRHPFHSDIDSPVQNPVTLSLLFCLALFLCYIFISITVANIFVLVLLCSTGNIKIVAASVIIVGAAVSTPVTLELSLLLPRLGIKGLFALNYAIASSSEAGAELSNGKVAETKSSRALRRKNSNTRNNLSWQSLSCITLTHVEQFC
ncbi:uncharacterized protein LOC110267179 isoform X2 [Arachis ipaensis]|uniref:uncharacterized protein LOC110267179 isoform X2 n=1 Tax=Arachis ipaensis TaxID=130454 RepID=UPI000A2B47FB|nr:uncharacterized protein LOC110267179 isoform X2 [Arachis ipaensis]